MDSLAFTVYSSAFDCTGTTGGAGSTGQLATITEERKNEIEVILGDAIVENKVDFALPEEVNKTFYFGDFVRRFCAQWTTRQLVNNAFLREKMPLHFWINLGIRNSGVFWELNKFFVFPVDTVLSNAPDGPELQAFIDDLEDRSVLEKHKKYFFSRARNYSTETLAKVGFKGLEHVREYSRMVNNYRLVVEGVQTSEDLLNFFENTFNFSLQNNKIYHNDNYNYDDYRSDDEGGRYDVENEKELLKPIQIYQKFQLKIEKPAFWHKLMVLLEDQEVKAALETLVN